MCFVWKHWNEQILFQQEFFLIFFSMTNLNKFDFIHKLTEMKAVTGVVP